MTDMIPNEGVHQEGTNNFVQSTSNERQWHKCKSIIIFSKAMKIQIPVTATYVRTCTHGNDFEVKEKAFCHQDGYMDINHR